MRCNGRVSPSDGRWLDDRRWVYDLAEPLPADQRPGALQGRTRFEFATGALAVLNVQSWPGSAIDEGQQFIVRLNGDVDAASVERHARCEVEGLVEPLAVRVLSGPERERTLRLLGRERDGGPDRLLLQACQRPFAAGARVRLVWGRGIAAADDAALRVRQEQRFQWTVRARLLAEFSCEREDARAACLPLRPMRLSFNAPVPRALAQAVRLVPAAGGAARLPRLDDEGPLVTRLSFDAPLPENTRYTLTLPPQVVDDAGRPLANATSLPLEVATGALPPLARFSASPFAVVEAPTAREAGPALLPMTLRHVQADLAGSGAQGALRTLHLGAATPDATLLKWITRLQRDQADRYRTCEKPLPAREAAARRQPLPAPRPDALRATEVIGVPLPARGLHIVEAESQLLGQALLSPPKPKHARTAALVTNLGVHFKRGRSSSLVWVTTLDRARPVPGAAVAVNDCRGQPLWSGRTDAQGLARITSGFDEPYDEYDDGEADAAPKPSAARCLSRDGLFVTARATLDGQAELGLVFSRWHRGIEPWRFGIDTAQGTVPDRRAHAVFSRTLRRAGEPLRMKHFVRIETERGLARVAAAELPTEVVVTHVGSDTVTRLPLPAAAWQDSRAAESSWTVPTTAPLGPYDVALQRGEQRLASGSFRVEAFRVPLVDARLNSPADDPVAPAELAVDGQLAALAGRAAQDDDKLTAYLVSAAHEAGYAWPEALRERLLAGLAAFVEGRLERSGPRRAGRDLDVRKLAALEALARHGRAEPRQMGSLAWTPAVWPTSALLDAWSLHRRAATLPQRAARIDELQRLLRSRLLAGGTTLRFATEETDLWWWLMEGPDANAARLVARSASGSAPAALQATVDARLQRLAIAALRRQLAELRGRGVEDGAVLVIDNASGAVLAWVGSAGRGASAPAVDAVLARRQPGSTLKPFVYGLALERRLVTPASLVDDSPLALAAEGALYRPRNYDEGFRGPVSVREALAASLNVPAVRVATMLGPDAVFDGLVRAGLKPARHAGWHGHALALGSADTTLLDLTNAYRALANAGRWSAPHWTHPSAPNTLPAAKAESPRVLLPPTVAWQLAHMLSDPAARAATFGLDSPLVTRGFAAVKTGTSKDLRDNWCNGFTDRYTVGVWVGNAGGQPMHGVSGSEGAAPVWREIVAALHQGRPSVAPAPPPAGGWVAANSAAARASRGCRAPAGMW